MIRKILFLLFILVQYKQCKGVIYQLNDTAYDLMPPVFALDDYSSCLKAADGTYCVLQLELHAGNEKLINIIQQYSEMIRKHYNHTILDRGVCVTEFCTNYLKAPRGLEQTLEACLNETIYEEYGLQAKLKNILYCDKPDEKPVIDTIDWMVAGIIAFVILINIVGSLYDYIIRRTGTKGNPYLLTFSVFQNWKWLVYQSDDPKLERLKAMHGIRTLAIVLMIMAHVIINYGGFIDNTRHFEKAYDTLYFQMIINGGVLIQLFFVMSGLLLALKMEIASEKVQLGWGTLPKVVFFRWLRLTPAYGLLIALTATWLRHLGSGPLWKLAVQSAAADCRDTWWQHLLYFNNYIGERGKFCAVQTWYIAADMQLLVIGVVVLLLSRAGGRTLALALLAGAGVVAPAAHVYLQGLEGNSPMTPELFRSLQSPTIFKLHILGHNNVSSFAVGMAAALLLYHCQATGRHFTKHKKLLRWLIFSSIPLVVLLIYLGCFLFLADAESSLVSRMVYQGLHRLVFSLIAAGGILGFALKFEDTLRVMLEWDGWVVPSRLGYSVYLLHMIFISAQQGTKTQLGHMSFFNLVNSHLSVVGLSFAAALPFCLAVEAPMIAIIALCKARDKGDKVQKVKEVDSADDKVNSTIRSNDRYT